MPVAMPPVAMPPVAYKEAMNRIFLCSLSSRPGRLCLHIFVGTLKLFQDERGGLAFLLLSVAFAHKRSLLLNHRLLPSGDTLEDLGVFTVQYGKCLLCVGWEVTFVEDSLMLTDLDLISLIAFIRYWFRVRPI